MATNGNDTTGNGTSGNPYLTIGKAISVMSAGGGVIIKDGTYSGTANWISTVQVTRTDLPGPTRIGRRTASACESR